MPTKPELIESLYNQLLLQDDEEIILSDGFETALIGISACEPKVAIYDYWKAVDCVMKAEPTLEFDDALDWLEEFVTYKIETARDQTPIFVKTI
tara:strand:+ start:239 stop:520 length:282 start_codon:yes stop_codon:yes gene_type:complete